MSVPATDLDVVREALESRGRYHTTTNQADYVCGSARAALDRLAVLIQTLQNEIVQARDSGEDEYREMWRRAEAAEARAVRAEAERNHLRRIANSAFVFLGDYEALHPDRELNGQEALREDLDALAGQEGKP